MEIWFKLYARAVLISWMLLKWDTRGPVSFIPPKVVDESHRALTHYKSHSWVRVLREMSLFRS